VQTTPSEVTTEALIARTACEEYAALKQKIRAPHQGCPDRFPGHPINGVADVPNCDLLHHCLDFSPFRKQKDRNNPRGSSACIHNCMHISRSFSPTLTCLTIFSVPFSRRVISPLTTDTSTSLRAYGSRTLPCREIQDCSHQVIVATPHG